MKDCFSRFHPAVNGLYFLLVLGISMTVFHPVVLAISLGCALVWSARLGGGFRPVTLLAVALLAAGFNPLFNHEGATILGYWPSGNPLTLESVLYGGGTALMLLVALGWFSCLNRVMTADKWMCLAGRALPTLSLLLSMTLRLVPRFRARLEEIRRGQRSLGRAGGGGVRQRAGQGIRALSILVTWSLEDAVTTADSMGSRGYGLSGRTAYTTMKLGKRDREALLFLVCAGGYLLLMALRGTLYWRYYPTVKWAGFDLWALSAYGVWLALCAMPIYLDVKEERDWKRIVSNM